MQNTIGKDFAKYVSLNIMGMLGLSCYILADTFFIANALGPNGLAALNFSISVYCILSGAGLMVGIGGASRYAVLRARNQGEEARAVFTRTVLCGMCIAAVFVVTGVFGNRALGEMLGADTDTIDMTAVYLRTVMSFAPFFILNNILLAFVRNDGNPRLSMAAMLIGSFSNILLDYVLVFIVPWGMFGAAFATGLAPIISMGVLLLHFRGGRSGFSLVRCKPQAKSWGGILALGLSSFVAEASSGMVLIAFNLVILRLEGNVGVAAYGIVANVALVITAVFTGIAQGIQPLVSKGCGEGEDRLLRGVLRYGLVTAAVLSVGIYAVLLLRSGPVIALFNSENNQRLAALADRGFRIYFAGFLPAGFNLVSAAFLSAMEQPRRAFAVSISRGFVVGLPLLFLFSRVFAMDGVWLSFAGAEIATAALGAVLLWRTMAESGGVIGSIRSGAPR